MGRTESARSKVGRRGAGLAGALFTGTQQRVLGLLFGQPGRSYYATELIGLAGAGSGAVQRELARLAGAGLLTVRPVGKRVYVSNGKDATVSVIDTQTNAVVATVPVGKRPWNMAITPDGKKLYVANGRSNSVSVIDTETNQKVKDIAVGELPWGVQVH